MGKATNPRPKAKKGERPAIDFPIARRQPDGRPRASNPSPSKREEAAIECAKRQRMARGATAENFEDQRHGSALGRLRLNNWIGEPLFLAGQEFATLIARFHARAGTGRATPPAADMERVRGYSNTDIEPDAWRKLQLAYTEAHRVLEADRRWRIAVWSLLVLDQDIPAHGYSAQPFFDAANGLTALAVHFNFDRAEIEASADAAVKRLKNGEHPLRAIAVRAE